jgi:hypothetical protein
LCGNTHPPRFRQQRLGGEVGVPAHPSPNVMQVQ